MSTTTEADRYRWQAVTTPDGITVCGTPADGWWVLGPLNQVVARYRDDDICAVLQRYRNEQEGDGLTEHNDGKHDAHLV